MLFDDMEDNEKGPFCKPFGQLFYDNLQMMPSFQIIEAYLACLIETQDRLNRAISILEATLKKGAERLKELDKPAELQFYYGKITNSKGAIEKEIEHLSQNRRAIDNLITAYSEKGILDMPIKDFMTTFDADYAIKVEKKKPDSEELYSTTIKATDLAECAGFEHLNKVMTGYLLRKLLKKKEA